MAEQIAEAARIGVGDRALDVGCGTGVLARAAADRVVLDQQVAGLEQLRRGGEPVRTVAQTGSEKA
jgi:cyclopropane fatty-acyl-phospholipid synthase-like methyltransferase